MEHRLTDKDLYYRECLTKMPSGPVALQRCYEAIVNLYSEVSVLENTPDFGLIWHLNRCLQVSEYVKEWLQYQNLWDMQAERLYERLGTDIQTWQVLFSNFVDMTQLIYSSLVKNQIFIILALLLQSV